MTYSNHTYRTLILFTVAITLFIGAWFVINAGGYGVLALPMVIPFFIAPALIYFFQLRNQNDRYALLLIPFVLYELLHLLTKIKLLLGINYGFEQFYPAEGVSLLGFPVPDFFNYLFGTWTGPVSIIALLLLIHSITVGAAYTQIIWKQFILPLILIIAIGFFALITLRQYSSGSQPQAWKKFISQQCNYSVNIHPAMTARSGDSFGNQHLLVAGYFCADLFAANTSDQRGYISVHMYSSPYSELRDWLLDGWFYGGTFMAIHQGHPLLESASGGNYSDEATRKAYFRKEIEKLLPTGSLVTVNGYKAIEFVKNDTTIVFIAGPNKQVAEVQCKSVAGTTITSQGCSDMLHSFSFTKHNP